MQAQPWYLDVVCNEGEWDVAMVKEGENVVGVWPYYLKKKFGIRYITQPWLTPYLGPIIIYKEGIKTSSRTKDEKRILSALANQIPKAQLIVVQGFTNWKNWQPLSWLGYKETTRYTFRLSLENTKDELWNNLDYKMRNAVRNAEKEISIITKSEVSDVYKLFDMSLKRKNQSNLINYNFLSALNNAVRKRNQAISFIAQYNQQNVASTYVLHDQSTAYLLLTGRSGKDPRGTVAALIWASIIEAKKRNLKVFDFEGSMIEGIASFFSAFGAEQVPYHRVYRTSSRFYNFIFHALNKV